MDGLVCFSRSYPAPVFHSNAAFKIRITNAETFLNDIIDKLKHLHAPGCEDIIPDIIVSPTVQDNGLQVGAGANCLTLLVAGLMKTAVDEAKKLARWCGVPLNI